MAANAIGYRGAISPALTNNTIFTTPALQTCRIFEVSLYNNHTGNVGVRVILGSAFYYIGTMAAGDYLPLAMCQFLNAGEVLQLYADVTGVVHYQIGVTADVNA